MGNNFIHIDNIVEDRVACPGEIGTVRAFRRSWTA